MTFSLFVNLPLLESAATTLNLYNYRHLRTVLRSDLNGDLSITSGYYRLSSSLKSVLHTTY